MKSPPKVMLSAGGKKWLTMNDSFTILSGGHAQLDPVEPTDPPIIPIALGELPVIEPSVLPDWASKFVREICNAREVDVTMGTLLCLPAIASTCQRAYRLQVERSFFLPLNIYTAPSLESGERKTGIHRPIMSPLFECQKVLRKEASEKVAEVEVERSLIEQKIKKLEGEHRKSTDLAEQRALKKDIVKLTGTLPELISLPQIIMDDFTEAALGVALAANDESLLVTSDEGGLFDNLSGRHNPTSEIDLFLKSNDGSPHMVNRTGRANLLLEQPLLSVGISPQPQVLMNLAGKPGFIERGLTARFAFAMARNSAGTRNLNPAIIRENVKMAYCNFLIEMAALGRSYVGDPKVIKLSDEAYEVWKAFERQIEPRMAIGADLKPIKPWASKLPGMVARIAGICHCGAFVGKDADHSAVSMEQMAAAVDMGKLLIPHSLAAHALMTGGGVITAKEVVAYYEATGWPAKAQSMTEWWKPVRRFVGDTSNCFESVADVLCDHGYLIPTEPPPKVGKRGTFFRVNRNLIRKSVNPK